MSQNNSKLLYALSCYLEKRDQKLEGDITRAAVALHNMDLSDDGQGLEIVRDRDEDWKVKRESKEANAFRKPVHSPQPPKPSRPANDIEQRRAPASASQPTPPAAPHSTSKASYSVEQTPTRSKPASPVQDVKVSDARNIAPPQEPKIQQRPAAQKTIASPEAYDIEGTEEGSEDTQNNEKERIRRARIAHNKTECSGCGVSMRKGEENACTSCHGIICGSCGEYPKVHKDSHVFYEYRFDLPLCKDCYLMAFKTQEEMGRATTYFRTGNFTYAKRHADRASEIADSWTGGKVYIDRARKLQETIDSSKPRRNGGRPNRREKVDSSIMDIKGDKWTRRYVERALARKGE